MAGHRIVLDCGPFSFIALLGRKESRAVVPSEGKDVAVLFSPEAVHVIEDGADAAEALA
jgi:hypothetical protein